MSNAKVQSTFVQISAASAHDPWAGIVTTTIFALDEDGNVWTFEPGGKPGAPLPERAPDLSGAISD
jgi:hypothetical protein